MEGRSPLHCPTVTQPEVVEKIIHLRQHYHFRPMKIAMYLKRYRDVAISTSGVANPEAARDEPPAGLPALQASIWDGGNVTRSSVPVITRRSTRSSSCRSQPDPTAESATTAITQPLLPCRRRLFTPRSGSPTVTAASTRNFEGGERCIEAAALRRMDACLLDTRVGARRPARRRPH